jgi:small conductance mechanosensitive channel
MFGFEPLPGAAKRTSDGIMHDLRIGEQDILRAVSPDSFVGAGLYLLIFIVLALLLSRGLRLAVHSAMTRHGHIDHTAISFLQQLGTAAIWVIMLILYAHLIPVLRAMGTALLAGASVASVVLGLAAQSTLGNLVAGIAITIYRPFRLGDTLQVTAPTGTEIGTVEQISLGYTKLRTFDGRQVVLPNSVAASQIAINLGSASTPAPLTLAIRVSRQTDIEAARREALRTARATLDDSQVLGCFLTRIEASAAVIELRIRAPDAADRDALRSKLVAALAQNFAASGLDTEGADRASFA